jgi:hypothetical protein
MSNLIRWRDESRLLPLLLIASLIVLLAVAAAAFLSRGTVVGSARPASLRMLAGAYDRVVPGRTSESQLAALGFDSARLQARSLSGLGVQEFFMPHTSEAFDRLDPAIRACFDAPDRCSALVFPLAVPSSEDGFMTANAAPRSEGRIVFLLKSGRVAYKAMQGA